MGIKGLHKFLETNTKRGIKEISTRKLENKVIALDASIFIYQYSSAIRSTIDDLKTSEGKVTTHIHGILTKTLSILKKKIKPIYIFDGKPPDIKQNILDIRKSNKTVATDELLQVQKKIIKLKKKLEITPETIEDIENQLSNINKLKELNDTLIKLQKRTVGVTSEQIDECKEIIKLLGIPIIEALEEADSQCAYLVKDDMAEYVASEDMDILTFGAKKLIRKLSAKETVVEYDLEIILNELELNQNEFIDLCILLGCDYTNTIPRVGPKKAYDLIKEYRSIDNILKMCPEFQGKNPKYNIPENFIYEQARNYFLNPPIKEVDSSTIIWKIPDYNKIKELLKTKYEYSDENINRLFGFLQGGYYSVITGEKTMAQYNQAKYAYMKKMRENIEFASESD